MGWLSQICALWGNEALLILAVCGGVVLFHHAIKVWNVPGTLTLLVLLILSLCLAAAFFYAARGLWQFHISSRAALFLGLYAWCVCAMLFFGRKTHVVKLLAGLASQAGILYALFLWL